MRVIDAEELAAAFARHQEVFGRLDICINNAGIGGGEPFFAGADWRKVIEVNLIAVIDGTSKAVPLTTSHSLLKSCHFDI